MQHPNNCINYEKRKQTSTNLHYHCSGYNCIIARQLFFINLKTKTQMANCNSWLELSLQEKIEMVGKVTHLIQNSNVGFTAIEQILHSAELAGMFNEVKINPPRDEANTY